MPSPSRSAVRLRDDQPHHLGRRVVDAVLRDRRRIEHPEEILVEVEQRVAPAPRHQHVGHDGVDRVAGHVERSTQHRLRLIQRERTQRAPQQRVGPDGQHLVGVLVHVPAAARLPREQQPEDQGLGEGGGEQGVAVALVMAAGLGTCEQRLVELGAQIGQDAVQSRDTLCRNHLAHQAGRLAENPGDCRRIPWRRLLGQREGQQDTLEPRVVPAADQPVRPRVRRPRVQRRRRHDLGLIDLLVTAIESHEDEVG